MEFNRNHYFMAGIVVLLLGVQFRMVESYVLNKSTTEFVNEHSLSSTGSTVNPGQFFAAVGPTPRKVVEPPEWLGWALMSIGSVLVLHSLAMKGPGAA